MKVVTLILALAITCAAQTRGAAAFTIGLNSNLGNAQGNLGALGTIEHRSDRFGFAATGTISQLKKNQGGSGVTGSGSAQARYFVHNDFFVSGGINVGGYTVSAIQQERLRGDRWRGSRQAQLHSLSEL